MIRNGKMAKVTACKKAETKRPVPGNVLPVNVETQKNMERVTMAKVTNAEFCHSIQKNTPAPASYKALKQAMPQCIKGRASEVQEKRPLRAEKEITLEQLFSDEENGASQGRNTL